VYSFGSFRTIAVSYTREGARELIGRSQQLIPRKWMELVACYWYIDHVKDTQRILSDCALHEKSLSFGADSSKRRREQKQCPAKHGNKPSQSPN